MYKSVRDQLKDLPRPIQTKQLYVFVIILMLSTACLQKSEKKIRNEKEK